MLGKFRFEPTELLHVLRFSRPELSTTQEFMVYSITTFYSLSANSIISPGNIS